MNILICDANESGTKNVGTILSLQGLCRRMATKGEITFLTESKRYGPEAHEVKAVAYLLKPVIPERIREVVRKVGYKQKRTDVRSPEFYSTVGTFRTAGYHV